ncbi:HNH endonuclease signature motif containing protein [uncultured Caulobacter sp.]|uniref:HNH endonuclease signature motif containing protein n=1 Tax=uncultured Caulobacter sp. TaxID=158749 RepID=UPI0026089907|nr:HNH endonuclease signature motif containing protein [uncultured Caulobacter sp.]
MRGRRIDYSADEMRWLEANRSLVISDYHRAFQVEFSRPEITAANLHSLRKRKGWKVGRARGRTAGRLKRYSPAEIAWLQENCTLPISEYHAAFVRAFGRADIATQHLQALRKRQGWKTGRTGHFAKGQAPMNKGKVCPPGVGGRHPNAQRTQFKKGHEPHNTKYLGHERVNVDGYVEISVAETNPHTGYGRRYVHKHVHLWQALHGPVPEGYCLKAIDGNRLNTDPSNWEAIPRGIFPRLNGGRATRVMAYDTAPDELKPTLLALAKVEHKARSLKRQKSQ